MNTPPQRSPAGITMAGCFPDGCQPCVNGEQYCCFGGKIDKMPCEDCHEECHVEQVCHDQTVCDTVCD